jgi:hypothetical protein
LLFEIALKLLCFLRTLLASLAAPDEKDDQEQEKDAEHDEKDLPPDESSTTRAIGRLLRVGIKRRDDDRSIGYYDQFGKADAEARGRPRPLSTVDIGANASSQHLLVIVAGHTGTSSTTGTARA